MYRFLKSLRFAFRSGFWVVAIAAANSGAVGAATGDGASPIDYPIITGVAHFEKHRVLTPQYCTQQGCAKPHPYWALVLDSGTLRYEFREEFAPGQNRAPESVQLDGVVVKSGMRLIVQARVDTVTRDRSVISEVQRVQIAMGPLGLAELTGGWEPDNAPFFGWECRSVSEALPVYVDVERLAHEGSYSMRIQAESGDREIGVRTIASFGHVEFNTTPDKIGFAGAEPRVQAVLDIDSRSGDFKSLESTLSLTEKADEHRAIRLLCDRTR